MDATAVGWSVLLFRSAADWVDEASPSLIDLWLSSEASEVLAVVAVAVSAISQFVIRKAVIYCDDSSETGEPLLSCLPNCGQMWYCRRPVALFGGGQLVAFLRGGASISTPETPAQQRQSGDLRLGHGSH